MNIPQKVIVVENRKCNTQDTQKYPVYFLKRAHGKSSNVQVLYNTLNLQKSPICVVSTMGTWALVVCLHITKKLSLHCQLPTYIGSRATALRTDCTYYY